MLEGPLEIILSTPLLKVRADLVLARLLNDHKFHVAAYLEGEII